MINENRWKRVKREIKVAYFGKMQSNNEIESMNTQRNLKQGLILSNSKPKQKKWGKLPKQT